MYRKELLKHLTEYLSRSFYQLPPDARINSKILHYYNEIIRYWNTLNYIINKTLRYMNWDKNVKPSLQAILFYVTYRFNFEQQEINHIKSEINRLNFLNSPSKKVVLSFLNHVISFSMEKALNNKDKTSVLSIRKSIPSFSIERLEPYLPLARIQREYVSMDKIKENAWESVGINLLARHKSKEEIIAEIKTSLALKENEITIDDRLPDLIYIPSKYKSNLIHGNLLEHGEIFFHDKASSVVVRCLNAQSHDFIFDMCAAPGVKTSLLAQYTSNESQIVANDFSSQRIVNSRNFLQKLGLQSQCLINADAIFPPLRMNIKFDRILLDAPCTGSGTFSSNPELKWRQNWQFLNQNLLFQKDLIQSAIKLLKPEGILVYSVCSLYAEEGEMQIKNILDQMDPLPLPDWLSPSYTINGGKIQGTGRLFPNIHNSQGFFIAKFKKKDV